MSYSRKNPNSGGGGGVRKWNFWGSEKKSMWKFQGSIKKEVEVPGVLKKN